MEFAAAVGPAGQQIARLAEQLFLYLIQSGGESSTKARPGCSIASQSQQWSAGQFLFHGFDGSILGRVDALHTQLELIGVGGVFQRGLV